MQGARHARIRLPHSFTALVYRIRLPHSFTFAFTRMVKMAVAAISRLNHERECVFADAPTTTLNPDRLPPPLPAPLQTCFPLDFLSEHKPARSEGGGKDTKAPELWVL